MAIIAPAQLTPTAPRAAAPARPAATSGRDRTVDLVRAACLLAVVGVHALMVGVSMPHGAVVLENALERWDGFTVFSWVAQMMPLFFIMGGFASALHYRRMRDRGASDAGYISARLERLLPVPLLAAAATTIALIGLSAAGLDPEIVATAGWRISQPLWFLGVYVLCSAFVPLTLRWHERAPRATLLGLGAAIGAVDGLRMLTGVDAVGFANLLLVWLFVQQLGYRLADGATPSPRAAVLAGGGIIALMAIGASPANLFEALNPPTAALALLGIVQCALFAAIRPRLSRWAELPAVQRVSDALNARAMTVYSWHMPVVVLLAGLLLVSGSALPVPLSLEWWATRPAWLIAAGLAVAPIVVALSRFERGPKRASGIPAAPTAVAPRPAGSARRAGVGTIAGAGGVLIVLAGTGAIWAWAAGAALMGTGLLVCRGRLRGLGASRNGGTGRNRSAQNAKAMPISTP